MTIPFKDKGQVIIAYRADGVVPEVDHRDQYFETVADYLKTIDEPDHCIRFIRFSERAGYNKDITDEVADGWLNDVDVLDWDESFGCPDLIKERVWDMLIEEARELERMPEDDGDNKYQAWKDRQQEDAA